MSERYRDGLYRLASALAVVAPIGAVGIIGWRLSELPGKGLFILLGFAVPAAMIGLTARAMRTDLHRSRELGRRRGRRWL